MPVPPSRPRNLHAALTAKAQETFKDAEVEIIGGRAVLILAGTTFDLGATPREAKATLKEKLEWFSEALKGARGG